VLPCFCCKVSPFGQVRVRVCLPIFLICPGLDQRSRLLPDPYNLNQDKSAIFETVLGHKCCLVIQSKCSQEFCLVYCERQGFSLIIAMMRLECFLSQQTHHSCLLQSRSRYTPIHQYASS
jgi:hypothetical protein